MSSLARSVLKPLKVPRLACSVPKTLKVPNVAPSVPKPLKVPSLASSVSKPGVGRPEGIWFVTTIPVDPLPAGCKWWWWWWWWNETKANFGSLIFMKPFYVLRVFSLNCYISKNVQNIFPMGLKTWWSWELRKKKSQ